MISKEFATRLIAKWISENKMSEAVWRNVITRGWVDEEEKQELLAIHSTD